MVVSGENQIRGLDIQKALLGFADEELVLERFLAGSSTSAREVRWYQKTSGFLDTTDTSGITASQMENVDELSQPVLMEQSFTRNTSTVQKYFIESPIFSFEDIRDTDVDVLATNVRDLMRGLAKRAEVAQFNVLTENQTPVNIQTAVATADGWDDVSTGDPILDLLNAKQLIRTEGYNPEGAVLYINPIEHKFLIQFLISTKGSSIPNFSSDLMGPGVVMELLGLRVVVSENATTDSATIFVPNRAAMVKNFTPLSSGTVDELGIGTKIRVWREFITLLTDPKAVFFLSDTITG